MRLDIPRPKLFSLSNNLQESLKEANVVFITVGTPTKRLENEADLKAVHEVAKEIAENIINYCKENMAGFKRPKHVIFGELPKTSTGKIQKFELRKKAKEI